MATQPSHIVYGVDSKVPFWNLLFLGLQHTVAMSSPLVIPTIFIAAIIGTNAQALSLIQATILAVGIGTVLMGIKSRFIGSGYLCPLLLEPSIYPASMLAAKAGGLPLVYGMNFVVGVFQVLFAAVLPKIRYLFPFEVTGVVIFMIGIALIIPGIHQAFGVNPTTNVQTYPTNWIISISALVIMVGLTIWGGKKLSLYALLIGTIIGTIIAWFVGSDFNAQSFAYLHSVSVFHVPNFSALKHLKFQWDLTLPFSIAALSSSLKAVGNLTACQKINDLDWVRADIKKIRKGIFTNGISSLIASSIGGIPTATSSSNVGLSIATHATSRYIAMSAGLLYVLFGFFPKVSAIFVIMPSAVKGAILLFVTSYVLIAGIQIMMSRMLDMRKIFIIGISIIAGVGFEFIPEFVKHFPKFLAYIFASPLTTATAIAIILNLLFRIGITRTDSIECDLNNKPADHVWKFLRTKGAEWGALHHSIKQISQALTDAIEIVHTLELATPKVNVNVAYDEFVITAKLTYDGPLFEDVNAKPSKADLRDAVAGGRKIALFMLHEHADEVSVKTVHDKSQILIQVNQ